MIAGTLGRYFAWRFFKTIVAVFLGVFVLIYAIDVVETLRRSGETPGAVAPLMAWLALLHTPIVAEQALPFAVLFGAMIAFLNLTRRLELVVARSAGVSVWQFLAPPIFVAAAIGIAVTSMYNPMSTAMKRQADRIEAKLFGAAASPKAGVWIRQKSVDGESVLHADGRDEQAGSLLHVQVFGFKPDGAFAERIDAESATLEDGFWRLTDAKVVEPGADTLSTGAYLLATTVTRADIAQAFVAPETVSFWELSELAEQMRRAGLDPAGYTFAISRASGATAAARGDGRRGRLLFIKIFPNGRRAEDGFRWRRGRLRALCCDEIGQRFGRGRLLQRGRRRVVAGRRRLLVWGLRASAPGGRLMGRSVSSAGAGGRRRGGSLAHLALGLVLVFAAGSAWVGSAWAQSAATQGAAARNPDKLVLEANELVYDKDHNTVTAIGGVELYYKHRVLQADRVVYNRTTKRLYAEGRSKLTDEKGNVTYAKRFDITDDFAAGFAEGVETVGADKTRFTSPRVERSAGAVTVFDRGVYTACEPCKLHPERPPLWQVRAAKIIENQQTHVVYYEDAWLEVAGVPVAYIPYFSAPDPTVTRASGMLAPTITRSSYLGVGVGIPYFLNLAPNYDLTVTPTYFSSQGPFLDAEWRQRLDTGQYNLRVTGLFQQNPSLFPTYPYDAGDRRWRGSLESQGEFFINDKWKWGWDITAMSDPFYLNDYKIKSVDPSQYYLQDVVSSVYLRGQADRGFFDLSGYRFESTTASADQRQQPVAAPVLDYNKTIALNPDTTGGLGGEIKIDLNATNIARVEAAYQSVDVNTLDAAYHLYDVCEIGGSVSGGYRTGGSTTGAYTPNNCLLRGIAGDYTRVSEQVSWQRKFTDPLGETWTPFVFARLDGEVTALNTAGDYGYGATSIPNGGQSNYFSANSELERTRDGRRRSRIPLPVRLLFRLRSAGDRADRAIDRPPRRGRSQAAA